MGHRYPKPGSCAAFAKGCRYLFAVRILPPVNSDEQVLKPPLIYTGQRRFPVRLGKEKKKKKEKKKRKKEKKEGGEKNQTKRTKLG